MSEPKSLRDARPPGFKITFGKGFHVTFDNGWTVSVQIGGGNYCANYDEPIGGLALNSAYELPPSATAEIAAWGPDGNWHDFGGDTVAGYKTPAEVLGFMQEIASK
jgi:hypothetical protein